MSKLELAITKFEKALTSLENIYQHPLDADRRNIDATIQRFEFTFELFWKLLKNFLNERGIELYYPKDVLREAFSSGLLEEEAVWLNMLKDRNLTSHSYDEDLADQIFSRIQIYVPLLRKTFNTFLAALPKP